MKLIVRIIAIAALGCSGALLAQTSTHPYVQNVAKSTKDACTQNPDACTNAKTRARQGVANAKTACLDNPSGCQQVQDKAKESAENTKARCEADPTSCQEAKSGALNRQQSRINRRGGN